MTIFFSGGVVTSSRRPVEKFKLKKCEVPGSNYSLPGK
jgi:hypothetical protein